VQHVSDRRFLVSFDLAKGPVRSETLQQLRAICKSVDPGMREMGVIVCDAPDSARSALRAIPGVIGVEIEGVISVGPPGGTGPQ
jgi:hypothetical protein